MKSEWSRGAPNSSTFLEAAEWLIEFREGEVSEEERARFQSWLRRSPENIHAYLEAAALWGDIPRLAAGMEVNVDEIVAHATRQANVRNLREPGAEATNVADPPSSSPSRGSSGRESFRQLWRYAAAFAVVLIAGGVLSWWNREVSAVYSTAIGEQRLITLSDGSTVHLGARSSFRVTYSFQERRIDLLTGQAVFSVARDEDRPFLVLVSNTQVRAVGTQFDVHRMRSSTVVSVLEGRVAVLPARLAAASPESGSSTEAVLPEEALLQGAAGSSLPLPLYVSAGEEITLPANPTVREFLQASVSARRGAGSRLPVVRTDQTLTFENVPVSDVVEEFNRYNLQQVEIADPELGSLRISGVFSVRKPASLLRFLAEQLHFQVTSTEKGYRISGSAQPEEK